jgi:hypothetical protein
MPYTTEEEVLFDFDKKQNTILEERDDYIEDLNDRLNEDEENEI